MTEPKTPEEWYLEPREYVAANLKEALKYVANTGDWYHQVLAWCECYVKDCQPNAEEVDWRDRALKAEQEVARYAQAFSLYTDKTRQTPVGLEDDSKGASVYNWRQSCLRELLSIIEGLRK